MLTAEQNERLTRVGPSTPMGGLMRRYWQPIAASAELQANPVKAIQVLGESLTLYRDRSGALGLVGAFCAHRHTALAYGMPEERGLRCPYHGWMYDAQGRCVEQPAEPPESNFRDRIQIPAYPVQELGGLIFAYLGPAPAPLLPRYNVLAWDNAMREINGTLVPANWVQVIENLLDPYHVEFLHGHYFEYILRRKGGGQLEEFLAGHMPPHMKRTDFDLFQNGIIERHYVESENEESWQIGAPIFFPNVNLMMSPGGIGTAIFVVPLDDTHTWFVLYLAQRAGMPLPPQDPVPFYDAPGTDENSRFMLDSANGQDHMAVVTQGEIAPRDLEHLAASDAGIIAYREMLMEQLGRVERGEDPINVHREPALNEIIDPPMILRSPRASA